MSDIRRVDLQCDRKAKRLCLYNSVVGRARSQGACDRDVEGGKQRFRIAAREHGQSSGQG
jgi:hypothetical protein